MDCYDTPGILSLDPHMDPNPENFYKGQEVKIEGGAYDGRRGIMDYVNATFHRVCFEGLGVTEVIRTHVRHLTDDDLVSDSDDSTSRPVQDVTSPISSNPQDVFPGSADMDSPTILALFDKREAGEVEVQDHNRVAIKGGWHRGNKGTIWHANRLMGIRIEGNNTPGRVCAVKHEVQLDGMEGTTLIENKYCVRLPRAKVGNEGGPNRWLDVLAKGLATMDQPTVETLMTALNRRTADLKRINDEGYD
jgi:hypothetical protein